MRPAREADPFALTADPSSYVPRVASEEALSCVQHALSEGSRIVLLSGPPGIGKTLLLRILEQRLAPRFRTLYLPHGGLSPEDLAHFVLGSLHRSGDASRRSDPMEALSTLVGAWRGVGQPALLALVDDVGGAGVAAVAELLARVRGVYLVAVPRRASDAEALERAFGNGAPRVELRAPLSPDESQDLIRRRLARAGLARSLFGRYDDATLRRLHLAAAGNPMSLQALASEILRNPPDAAVEARRNRAPSTPPTAPVPPGSALPDRTSAPNSVPELRKETQASAAAAPGPAASRSLEPKPAAHGSSRREVTPSNAGVKRSAGKPRASVGSPTGGIVLPLRRAASAGRPRHEIRIRRRPEPTRRSTALRGWVAALAVVLLVASGLWLRREAPGASPPTTFRDIRPPVSAPPPASPRASRGKPRELPLRPVPGPTRPAAVRSTGSRATVRPQPGPPVSAPAAAVESIEHAPARTGPRAISPASTPPRPAAGEPEPAVARQAAREPEPAVARPAAGEPEPAVARQAATEPERLASVGVWDSGPSPIDEQEAPSPSGPEAGSGSPPEIEATTQAATRAEALSGPVDSPSEPPAQPALPEVAPLVKVHINATPWAEIEVDGRALGVTPLGNVAMDAGSHEILARFPDGHVVTRSVTVSDTQRRVSFERD